MGSGSSGSATFLDDEVTWETAGIPASPMMAPTQAVGIPIRRIYPVVEAWLRDWPRAFQARLTRVDGVSSGYRLDVELSDEEGDRLLGSLLEDVAEEEAEEEVPVPALTWN